VSSETLKALFEPQSVAVVGASPRQGKAGYFLFRNILEGGFGGRLYAVNPNAKRVLGQRSYGSVLDLPERPDLAVLVVPNPLVKPAFLECAEKKVKVAVIVTAGFSEIGKEGAKAEQELRKIISGTGLRAVGPNSVGLVNAGHKLIASFVPFRRWPEGPIAIAAQTGIFAGAYADQISQLQSQRPGFSLSLCFGNKIDIDETDFLEYAGQDTRTKVVALHLESLNRPREFLATASRVKREKPLIVLKTGRTEQGARAAASHTGSLAASDRVVDAAFRQYGLIRAESLEELLGIAKALAW
jgi:acetyltransferase